MLGMRFGGVSRKTTTNIPHFPKGHWMAFRSLRTGDLVLMVAGQFDNFAFFFVIVIWPRRQVKTAGTPMLVRQACMPPGPTMLSKIGSTDPRMWPSVSRPSAGSL
jgi:hypothetical protein